MLNKIVEIENKCTEIKELKSAYKELWNCRIFTNFAITGENGNEMSFSMMFGYKYTQYIDNDIVKTCTKECLRLIQSKIYNRAQEVYNSLNSLVNNTLIEEDFDDNYWKQYKI